MSNNHYGLTEDILPATRCYTWDVLSTKIKRQLTRMQTWFTSYYVVLVKKSKNKMYNDHKYIDINKTK
jgi:hypothetical protein